MKKPRPPLLTDQILMSLHSKGALSHPELAYIHKRSVGCIRTTNSHNRAMGYIETVGKSMNRAAGPVRFSITECGVERVIKVLTV